MTQQHEAASAIPLDDDAVERLAGVVLVGASALVSGLPIEDEKRPMALAIVLSVAAIVAGKEDGRIPVYVRDLLIDHVAARGEERR